MSFACISTSSRSASRIYEKPRERPGVKGQVMIDAPPRASYIGIFMSVLLAGLLLLFLTGALFSQAPPGKAKGIGSGGAYRPNCWTPMKLRLRPMVGDTRTYKIAIV